MQYTVKKILNPSQEFWQSFDNLVKQTCAFTVQLNSTWLTNYITYYFTGKQSVFILAVYNNEDLVGCLPLQASKTRATRFYNFTELRILGFKPTDFFDIPVAQGNRAEILKQIIIFLKKDASWDKMVLTELPENSQNVRAFITALKEEKIKFELDTPNGFAYTKTNGAWKEYFETTFKLENKDLAKSERRLQRENYELHFTTYSEGIYSELQKNINLYEQRRKSLGQSNKYNNKYASKFIENVIEAFEEKGMVVLTVLKVNGEAWAFQLDWIADRIRYHWNHAYNEDFKRYSPGKLILKELLKNSFQDPEIDYCNHMRGLSSYKEKFTEEQQMLQRIKIDNPFSKRIKLTRFITKVLKNANK